MSENIPVCFICDKFVVDDVRHVGARGRQTLIQAAIIRGDSKIQELLEDESIPVPDVHAKCYRPYTQHERVAKRIEKERASSRYFFILFALEYMISIFYFLFCFHFFHH